MAGREARWQPLSEVSPKRKHRAGPKIPKRRHTTDLEEVDEARGGPRLVRGSFSVQPPGGGEAAQGEASALVPAMPRGIRKLVQRPVAALPRTPALFVKFGAPLSAEDLTHDAPSALFESRKVIDDILERRQSSQSAPDYVAPDTPFWRLPPKVLNKTGVAWKGVEAPRAFVDEAEEVRAPSSASSDEASESAEAAAHDHLQGITDLKKSTKWRLEAVSPEKCAAEVLDGTSGSAGGEGDGLGVDASSPEQAKLGAAARRGAEAGEGLVAALRRKAEDFASTGVEPELRDSLMQALQHHPGTERSARLQEMREYAGDFETLVLEGKVSVANCNDLIRAQGLQGRMEDAMRTHDAMQTTGYYPNDETYISLMIGACHKKDAELARNIFLMMRKQLISATPKVYGALMKAHVVAGDVPSAFALLHKMQDEQLRPDVVTYTILIDGLIKSGELEKAWEEFHSMRTWKLIEPDEVLFTVMIKACAEASEAERAINLFDDLRMSGLYPTDITYGELIRAMSTSTDLARKAFDFYRQMQAEDLPITPFVYSQLLRACRRLGDARRAQGIVADMRETGTKLEPDMLCELVGVFATAMKKPRVTEQEILRNLRCAWHVVGEARLRFPGATDWTQMLNEVMGVYMAAGFSTFAVDMLQQFAAFGVQPNTQTWVSLLTMLGKDMKDVARFFALWEILPRDPKPSDELYQLALEMALDSRSAKRTVSMMQEMYEAQVFPSPQLTERLAQAGRHVIQIHELVGKLISLNKTMRMTTARRENELLQTHIDERMVILASQGLTDRSPTPAQEARQAHFESLKKRGFFRRVWKPYGEYVASKAKGGEAYAKRHDRPRPNILAS